jgi:exopolysaccharide biosynthesis polyprenyl glycosylphosphotransferase
MSKGAVDLSQAEVAGSDQILPTTPLASTSGRISGVHFSIRERRSLLAAADVLTGGLASLPAYVGYAAFHGRLHGFSAVEPVLFGLSWLVALLVVDGYTLQIPTSRAESAIAVAKALPLALLIVMVTFFLHPYHLSRSVVVLAVVLGALLLIAMRITLARALLHESLAMRAILLGDAEPGPDIISTLDAARFECRVVAKMIRRADRGADHDQMLADLRELLEEHRPDELIVTRNHLRRVPELVEECLTHGVRVVSGSDLVELYLGRVPVETIDAHWYLSLPDEDRWRWPYALGSRLTELTLSLVIGLPFVVMLPLLAVAIKADSPGPVFHTQRRVGQHGKEFDLLKLRTMAVDAESAGPQLAVRNDPRATRLGGFLRSTRLDEVPQLLNVIRGEMSLIGPRPERPEFVAALESAIPRYRARLLLKPGVTGWAQIKGGYASTKAEMTRKLEYDLYYIKNRSLRLDLQILAYTFVTVLRRRGR